MRRSRSSTDRILREERRRADLADARRRLRRSPTGPGGVHLLPQWDEFLLGYKSRDVTLPPEHFAKVVPGPQHGLQADARRRRRGRRHLAQASRSASTSSSRSRRSPSCRPAGGVRSRPRPRPTARSSAPRPRSSASVRPVGAAEWLADPSRPRRSHHATAWTPSASVCRRPAPGRRCATTSSSGSHPASTADEVDRMLAGRRVRRRLGHARASGRAVRAAVGRLGAP